jgi:hypothetical protein
MTSDRASSHPNSDDKCRQSPNDSNPAKRWLSVLILGSLPGATIATISDAAYVIRHSDCLRNGRKAGSPLMRAANATSHGIIGAFTAGLIIERLLELTRGRNQPSPLGSLQTTMIGTQFAEIPTSPAESPRPVQPLQRHRPGR